MGFLLSAYGVDVENIDIGGGDPGELSQDDADYLRSELGMY